MSLANRAGRYVPSTSAAASPYQGLWLELADNRLTCRVTDGQLAVSMRLPVDRSLSSDEDCAATVGQPDEIALPIGLFTAVLRRLPAGCVQMSIREDSIAVTAGPFNGEIHGFRPGEAARPAPGLVPGLRATLPGRVVAEGFRHMALSLGDHRAWGSGLMGVKVLPVAGALEFTATDRRTLAQATLRCPDAQVPPPLEGRPVLIPRGCIDALAELLGDRDPIDMVITEERVEFRSELTSVQAPVLSEPFVDYEPVVKGTPATILRIGRRQALAVLERVSVLARGAHPIVMDIGRAGVQVGVDGGEVGGARESFDAIVIGAPCSLALPLWTTLAILRQLADDQVCVAVRHPAGPVKISGIDRPNLRYFVMPVVPVQRLHRFDHL